MLQLNTVSERRMKMKAEINEIDTEKTVEKINELRAGSLKRLIKSTSH